MLPHAGAAPCVMHDLRKAQRKYSTALGANYDRSIAMFRWPWLLLLALLWVLPVQAQSPPNTLTLSWTLPTTRADGSPLTPAPAARLYWGRTSQASVTRPAGGGAAPYEQFRDIAAGGTSSAFTTLTPATWYFRIIAFDPPTGLSSDFGPELSLTINPPPNPSPMQNFCYRLGVGSTTQGVFNANTLTLTVTGIAGECPAP